jgi:hypothetical protein
MVYLGVPNLLQFPPQLGLSQSHQSVFLPLHE